MNKTMTMVALAVSAILFVPSTVYATQTVVSQQQIKQESPTLAELIDDAIANDANRLQYYAQSQAMRESGIASSTLKDPVLKVGVGGLPTDSFALDQDPMSNVSVGLMQQFGRGSTLDLQNKKAQQQADGAEFQVVLRELDVANNISQLWYELGFQQKSERVLIENQQLMREMERFIQTNYAIGNSESQDLIRAQLQVSKLDDKLQANRQMQARILSQLSEWLGANWLSHYPEIVATTGSDWHELDRKIAMSSQRDYYMLLNRHPMAQMADVQISASETQVAIAHEAYRPQFGVYGCHIGEFILMHWLGDVGIEIDVDIEIDMGVYCSRWIDLKPYEVRKNGKDYAHLPIRRSYYESN
ncbi:TolC family protein [Vibrio methylphosphonaticus]|uniref:TolC family protein n=1 Tax=Vibrio methylphosphonaticus TaxID=2946866 RepID=UPI0038733D2A